MRSVPVSRYRPPARRDLAPLPPRWQQREQAIDRARFSQFILLSMLLHALAIALFGAPTGGSREGRAMWGSLQVVLVGVPPEIGPRLRLDPKPAEPVTPVAPPAVREAPPPAPRAKKEVTEKKKRPPPKAFEAPVEQPLAPAPPLVVPRLLDRITTPDRTLSPPPLLVPPPTDLQVFPPPPPPPERKPPPQVSVPAIEAPVQTPSSAAPSLLEAPALAPAPLPRIERAPSPPPVIAAPLTQPLPQRSTTQRVERDLVETPAIPVPVPPPPRIQHAPVEVQAIPLATPDRVAPAPRIEAAPAIEPPRPQQIPQVTTKPPPTALERALREAQTPPRTETPAARPDVPAAPATRAESPAKAEPTLRPTLPGSPAPGESLFRRPAEPPSGYDPTAAPKKPLDLDAMRKRAGQMAKEGSGQRALLPFPMPGAAAPKTSMEKAIENARKPDCRTAYQNLGLAAIVPLIANEFGEGNCRW